MNASPADKTFISEAVIAAMPEANATDIAPPSRAVILSSNARIVGLPILL